MQTILEEHRCADEVSESWWAAFYCTVVTVTCGRQRRNAAALLFLDIGS